jgi:quinol monooxygenase YgiN
MSNPLFTPHRGVAFQVTIKIDPTNIEKFLEALRPCWLAVREDPECLCFDVFHSSSAPGTFLFIEVWGKDNDWIEKHHLTKEYFKKYCEATESMWLEKEVKAFDRLKDWNFVDEKYLEGSIKAKDTEVTKANDAEVTTAAP